MWVAVGGRATLYSAVAGALAVNYGKTWFHCGTARCLVVCFGWAVRAGDVAVAQRCGRGC